MAFVAVAVVVVVGLLFVYIRIEISAHFTLVGRIILHFGVRCARGNFSRFIRPIIFDWIRRRSFITFFSYHCVVLFRRKEQ